MLTGNAEAYQCQYNKIFSLCKGIRTLQVARGPATTSVQTVYFAANYAWKMGAEWFHAFGLTLFFTPLHSDD